MAKKKARNREKLYEELVMGLIDGLMCQANQHNLHIIEIVGIIEFSKHAILASLERRAQIEAAIELSRILGIKFIGDSNEEVSTDRETSEAA